MHPDFDLDLLYLNHAAIAPWPKRTVKAVADFAAEQGRLGSKRYLAWLTVEQRLRERSARLIGADSAEEIALLKSTSEGLSFIAQGLDWQDGDNIVTIAQEFPSNRIVWETLAERGVALRSLDLSTSAAPEADLLALCDPRTRLIAVSWVQYGRGQRLDIAQLAAACRQRGILLCLDAIQGLGAIPFDLATSPVDFIVADGHKWMLGPEGLALFWCRPELRDQLSLTEFGWHMVEAMGDFDRKSWRPAESARRFECGSPNMLGIHALEASLSLLEETGAAQIAGAIEARVARLIELIDQAGFELLSPRAPQRRAGIVTFRVPEADQSALYQRLMAQGLMCASRGGGLRFSPHFYTPEHDLQRAIELTKVSAQHQHSSPSNSSP
ncbi:aminotransferase class V-fold PLP-dependent enzyme [Halochromatium roseum]|uniref:aminotransferase class V-fold PLP-dependent enzyme n=1 Tax=Halochromatium roseum TaxID=391920 RepID=UPI00191391F6|nr:aminotransferase class V-fold PLP-dependent enzyme [Halochromatium roseum]MBK5939018.1 aminotransferase [Halochromatium roseum]